MRPSQIADLDTLIWQDVTSDAPGPIDFQIEENAATIAGVNCDLLTANSGSETLKYYFNKHYRVTAEGFMSQGTGLTAFGFKQTQSLPLKMIIDSEEEHITMTASEINEMNVETSEFDLPDLPRRANNIATGNEE